MYYRFFLLIIIVIWMRCILIVLFLRSEGGIFCFEGGEGGIFCFEGGEGWIFFCFGGGEGGYLGWVWIFGVRVGFFFVLEVVRVEFFVLRGEGGICYFGRDEGRIGVFVKFLRKMKIIRFILLFFKIVIGVVMIGMFFFV